MTVLDVAPDRIGSPSAGPDSGYAVEVEHVSKQFFAQPARQVQALLDVSFKVRKGEVIALTGRSGCGKTTLLRIIMGLEQASSGTVKVGGKVVTGCGLDRGIVFQHAELLPWRTALGNVMFGLESRGVAKAERVEIARDALRLVGLDHAMDRHPHELSGGMKQRVGLARALAIDPQVLLMDEPFSALDAQTREVMQQELLDIQARTGKTIIIVSHDLDESVLLADRIIAMLPNPGRMQSILETGMDRALSLDELRGSSQLVERRQELWKLIHTKESGEAHR
ncbi:ABC transporter ATP-binding protein [Oleomonas cavernae]|uniref:ABC transporter ATP-binding protein n=1 Tax=Oleomonas cavernae TaxID=2320859 RepID=A0A418W8N4_9PROT|nr:ABC transporter ATP-binding protein [Oleomonas cavernae]